MLPFLQQYKFAFLISMMPFFVLSFFTNPFAEDFGFATMAQEKDFLELLKISYTGMNGRYMANIFMYLSPLTFNSFLGYKIAPILFISLTIFSLYFLLNQLLSFSKSTNFTITLGLTSMLLCGLPIASEGLFWYTGASIYYLGIIVSMIAFGQLVKTLRHRPKFYNYLLTIILFLMACGFNETQTASNVLFILLVTINHLQRNTNHTKALLLLVLMVFGAAAIMFLAPGNENRASMYALNTQDVLHSTKYSLAQLARFSLDWVLSLPLLIGSLLFIANFQTICQHSKLIAAGFYMNKWVTLVLLFVPILIAVFPAYWFTGILGQHRTLNVGFWMFLVAWFINLSAWSNSKPFNHVKSIPLNKHLLIMALALSCLLTDNGFHALSDLISGKANSYNEQMNIRHELLAKTPNKPQVKLQLKPIDAKPKLLYVGDIKSDPNFWMNLGYNDYYHLDQVSISIAE